MRAAAAARTSPAATPEFRFLSRARADVAIAIALGVVSFAASWARHAVAQSRTYDLAVFEQALWKMSRGRAPELSMVGWNAFADHLSPILLPFVPLYRLAATPLWLFAAQSIAFALGLLALRPLLDELGVASRLRAGFYVMYAASPLLWNALMFDFHPTTLAVPLVIAGITAALRGSRRALFLCALGILLCRDDLGPAVALMALVGARRHGDPLGARARAAVAALGLGWFAMGSALAAALGSDRHWAFHFGPIAASATAAIAHPIDTIPRLARALGRTANLRYIWNVFVLPSALLPLLRPWWIAGVSALALPLLASAGPLARYPFFHYGAPLFPFLLYAAVAGARRVAAARGPGLVVAGMIAFTALSFARIGPPAAADFFPGGPPAADVRRAIALVRPEDDVVATETIGPHLAHRDVLLPFPYPFASVKMRYPLTRQVREVSAARAAAIDVVVAWRREGTLPSVLASPYFRDFRLEARVGEVVVYRRAAHS